MDCVVIIEDGSEVDVGRDVVACGGEGRDVVLGCLGESGVQSSIDLGWGGG